MNSKAKETLVKVATMYYMGNKSQEEIARILNFSRTKVSRLLDFARKTKVIEFKINQDSSLKDEWANKIRNHFNLKDVIIVSSESNFEDTKKLIGKVASEYIDNLLVNDICIGLAWGTTIEQMVKQFKTTKNINNSWVVQLNGGTNIESDSLHMDGSEITRTLARKLNASCSILQSQYIVKNKLLRKLLMEEDVIKRHFQKFADIDVAIVGVESMNPEDNIPYKAGYITLEESKELIDTGFAADICGNRFTLDGEEKENLLTGRILSIELQTLKKVPLVIALAEGDRKALPLLASIRGGYVNILIIDKLLALTIMSAENII